MIQQLIKSLERLSKALSKIKSVNVNSELVKNSVVEVCKHYFTDCRPSLAKTIDEVFIKDYDLKWQALIKLAHGNNAKSSFQKCIKTLIKLSKELSVATLSHVESPEMSHTDNLILKTMEQIAPTAALSYKQGILDLLSERVSYRGSATEFREALRETLDHLAPDTEVIAQQNFKYEENQKKPTMKQKVKFILKSRDRGETLRTPTEKSADLVEELSGQITRAIYDRASLSTHVLTTKNEVEQIKRYVDTILFDILEIK